MIYLCQRCGLYETSDRSHMINHYKKKFRCEPKLEDLSVDELCNKLPTKHHITKHNLYYCDNCFREFTKSSTKCMHRKICSNKLTGFGNEDYSFLSINNHEILLEIYNKIHGKPYDYKYMSDITFGTNCVSLILFFIEYIYFNSEKPYNRNIYFDKTNEEVAYKYNIKDDTYSKTSIITLVNDILHNVAKNVKIQISLMKNRRLTDYYNSKLIDIINTYCAGKEFFKGYCEIIRYFKNDIAKKNPMNM